jgi:hypothetical protein
MLVFGFVLVLVFLCSGLWVGPFALTGWSAPAVGMGSGMGKAYRLVRSRHILWVFEGSSLVSLLVWYRNHGLD